MLGFPGTARWIAIATCSTCLQRSADSCRGDAVVAGIVRVANDYLTLSQKANGDATKNLTADEFVRYWRLHAVLLELDAEAIHGRTMIFERQGSAGR